MPKKRSLLRSIGSVALFGMAIVVRLLKRGQKQINGSSIQLESNGRQMRLPNSTRAQASTTKQMNVAAIMHREKLQLVILGLGLVLTLLQVVILWRQTEIMNRQVDFQVKLQERQDAIQQTLNREELRNAISEIQAQYPSAGTDEAESLRQLSGEDNVNWIRKVLNLLESQTKNPVLIQNRECLVQWHHAIFTAKFTSALLAEQNDMEIENLFLIQQAKSIHKDIIDVWYKLDLDSDSFYRRTTIK